MRPRANVCYVCARCGERGDTDGESWIESFWELTDSERELIATGSAIVLRVWGGGTPPVALYVGDPIKLRPG